MSGARDETIRKQQAKGGAGTWNLSGCGLGLGPIGPGRWSGGVDDLPSECPFGAERRTERTALRLTFRLLFGAAVSDLSVAGFPYARGEHWRADRIFFLVATLPAR
jgi:hypothetical protein